MLCRLQCRNDVTNILTKKGTTLKNKQTPLNFETIKRLIKQKTQEKFSQEAIASCRKTQWQNINPLNAKLNPICHLLALLGAHPILHISRVRVKSTWEDNKNKPRKQAVANFRLNTGHDCIAAHLNRIKIFSHNYCTICNMKNTTMDKDHLLVCTKLDHTSKELSKLYWDARRLME